MKSLITILLAAILLSGCAGTKSIKLSGCAGTKSIKRPTSEYYLVGETAFALIRIENQKFSTIEDAQAWIHQNGDEDKYVIFFVVEEWNAAARYDRKYNRVE